MSTIVPFFLLFFKILSYNGHHRLDITNQRIESLPQSAASNLHIKLRSQAGVSNRCLESQPQTVISNCCLRPMSLISASNRNLKPASRIAASKHNLRPASRTAVSDRCLESSSRIAAISHYLIFICTSRSWSSVTGLGEPNMRSCAFELSGKAITSRIFSSPVRSITIRSMPGAIPA